MAEVSYYPRVLHRLCMTAGASTPSCHVLNLLIEELPQKKMCVQRDAITSSSLFVLCYSSASPERPDKFTLAFREMDSLFAFNLGLFSGGTLWFGLCSTKADG